HVLAFAAACAGCNGNWSGEAPPTAPAQPAGPRFGAIAYSPSTNKNGVSFGQPTQQVAEWAAVPNGGAQDGRGQLWVSQRCGAMAVGATRVPSAAPGKTREEAELRAMNDCAKKQAGCQVQRWVCSR